MEQSSSSTSSQNQNQSKKEIPSTKINSKHKFTGEKINKSSSNQQKSQLSTNTSKSNLRKPQTNEQKTHLIKKRTVSKPFQRPNDIYVTHKTNFKAQLTKCETFLTKGEPIFIHCMGNSITRGMNLALTLVEDPNFSGYGYEANTSTIEIIDDFHPLFDDEDFMLSKRLNSCLHIKVFSYSPQLPTAVATSPSSPTTLPVAE